jgi:hypothetical protein
MSVFDIEQEIHHFIDGILRKEEVGLMVCSERKATAIMRALIEDTDQPLPWTWDKILSSLAVDQFDWVSFAGNKILMFDELVHHGKTLSDSITTLETAIKNAHRYDIEIKTASFAVWEGCTYRPDYAYYPSVDAETYEKIREDIVVMLQDHGSLLLDTEHIELSVRLQCGMREFYDTLARMSEHGNSYSFVSGGQRLNLTIGNPDIIDEEATRRCLLPGSNIDNVVRKVRVVEKTNEKFSILPILYPNTRCEFDDKWASNLPDFLDKSYLKQAPHHVLFYHVSLLAGIELLRGVASVLTDLTSEGTVLEIPRENFQHLRSLFPRVNIDGLWEYVSHVISEGQRIKPQRGRQSSRALRVEDGKLLGLCWYVMKHLVSEYDDIPEEGVSWKRLMEIAAEENERERIALAPKCLTVVADRLIDNSLLVTGVRELKSNSGHRYVIRTFSAEGEVVSDRIRQQMMVRNPECLRVT